MKQNILLLALLLTGFISTQTNLINNYIFK
jgi:hypothetical protein